MTDRPVDEGRDAAALEAPEGDGWRDDATLVDSAGLPRPYVIVVGNEKGGTGKSTTAAHLAVALMKLGLPAGALDLDARRATLSTYLEHRRAYAEGSGRALELPRHRRIESAVAETRAAAEAEDRRRLTQAFADLAGVRVVVIDTPGHDSTLSRLAHANADTLITPLNDSFLDIDVLAHIDRDRRQALGPSVYTRLVWEQNNRRILAGRAPIDWVVMRNRLSHIDARNKREIGTLLELLARRIGFRLAPGLGERVIYRELFLSGLTVLDAAELPGGGASGSHLAARQEMRALLQAIGVLRSEAA